MNLRQLSAAASTAAALVALVSAPLSHAEPVDPAPPCLAEWTCMLLTPNPASRYLPLTPAANAQQAPLTPAVTAL